MLELSANKVVILQSKLFKIYESASNSSFDEHLYFLNLFLKECFEVSFIAWYDCRNNSTSHVWPESAIFEFDVYKVIELQSNFKKYNCTFLSKPSDIADEGLRVNFQDYLPLIMMSFEAQEIKSRLVISINNFRSPFHSEDKALAMFIVPHIQASLEININSFITNACKNTRKHRAVFSKDNKLLEKTPEFDSFIYKVLELSNKYHSMKEVLASACEFEVNSTYLIKVTYIQSYRVVDISELDLKVESLSEVECKVCALLLRAATNKQIQERLGLKIKTVESHIKSIMLKLEVTKRAEIISYIKLSNYNFSI